MTSGSGPRLMLRFFPSRKSKKNKATFNFSKKTALQLRGQPSTFTFQTCLQTLWLLHLPF